jgi:hypothetical protein
MSNDFGAVMKSLLTKKRPRLDRFSAEFYKTFKEKLTPMLFKLFHRIEREGMQPNSFCEASTTLILNWVRTHTHKKNPKL